MSKITYVVDGGLGKGVAFSAVVEALAKRDGQSIQIYSPYYECFSENPYVSLVLDQNTLPITDSRIIDSDKIWYSEPYKSTFVKGKQHIIESFCECLGVKYTEDMHPRLYTDRCVTTAQSVLDTQGITGEYTIVQFTGGQTPVGYVDGRAYQSIDPHRNYPYYLAQEVVYRLKKLYPHRAILNFSLPNEPQYDGAVRIETTSMVWHEILKGSYGFIAIDSCLNHFSTSAKTKGVCLWSNTRWSQFGYSQNINMNFHNKGKWIESVFNSTDPRNIMVDPKQVVAAYSNISNIHK